MKQITLILSGILLSASALAADGTVDAENGKRLYEENPEKCLRCHAEGEAYADVFTKETRAADMAQLESWVRGCDVKFKTNWFDDEIMDVVAYLNQTYYQLPDNNAEATSEKDDATENIATK